MDAGDRQFLCNALGFALVLLRGEHLPPGEQAARARGLAGLIEAFCANAEAPALPDRMAAAIASIAQQNGACLPQDLNARGFTPDEVSRYWTLAQALAAVELRR